MPLFFIQVMTQYDKRATEFLTAATEETALLFCVPRNRTQVSRLQRLMGRQQELRSSRVSSPSLSSWCLDQINNNSPKCSDYLNSLFLKQKSFYNVYMLHIFLRIFLDCFSWYFWHSKLVKFYNKIKTKSYFFRHFQEQQVQWYF